MVKDKLDEYTKALNETLSNMARIEKAYEQESIKANQLRGAIYALSEIIKEETKTEITAV